MEHEVILDDEDIKFILGAIYEEIPAEPVFVVEEAYYKRGKRLAKFFETILDGKGETMKKTKFKKLSLNKITVTTISKEHRECTGYDFCHTIIYETTCDDDDRDRD